MAGGVLHPEDVSPADAARVIEFINRVGDASALAATIGFSEGPSIGRQVAEAILQRRSSGQPLGTLAELLAVTGVNFARFTEIVVSLSGARPAAAGTMRLMPSATRPWLGQKVLIAGQLLDASGGGVPGAEISCVASSGFLSAPNRRGEIQRGASVRLTTEPAGIVNLELQPQLSPALDGDAATALEAELARIGTEADSPAAVAPALAAFAARYRADASSALREAVDRLFAAYPVDTAGVGSSWPVETVTIIAIAEGADGQPALAGTTTLFFRNWLGAWLAELAGAVRSDRRLDEALSQLETGASETDAARGLMLVTQAFANLERGIVGGRERDKIAGLSANRFLEKLGDNVSPAALENVVRAAGASSAAVSAGGFAVFNAIQTVQNASEAIGPRRVDAGQLGALGGRLAELEAKTVDRTALEGLRADILTLTDAKVGEVKGKVASLESDRVTKTQLQTVAADLKAAVAEVRTGVNNAIGTTRDQLAAQIAAKADQAAVNQSLTNLVEGRLARLEARAVDRTALEGLRADILTLTDSKVGEIKGKVASLEADRVTKTQFERVAADLTTAVGSVRSSLDTAIVATRDQLTAQINTKADAAAVAGLNQSVRALQSENQRFSTQFQNIDPGALKPRGGPGR
jgi:hypothetical protein